MTWAETNLGQFAPFSYGKGLPKDMRIAGSVPVYGSNGVVGSHSEALVPDPAVIVGRKGSVGEVHLSEGPSWPIDTAFYVQGSDKADLHFLFYLLQTLPITSNSDSAVPGLSREYVHSIEFKAPSLETQRAIGKTLRVFDRKISLNDSLSKTLEEIAHSIFQSWFIDFDPVKAKMLGEAPVGMDAETAALFPDSLEESELGEVPSGWVAQPLDSIADYLNGLALQKFPVLDDSDVLPVIKIAQLRAGHTRGADFASGSLDPRYVVEDGDILFSWSGTLEVEYWTGGRGALNQHLFKVSGNTVPDWFAYFATRSFLGEFRAIASSKATTMGHIQRRHLTEALLAVPPNDVLEQASRFIGPLVSLRTDLLKQNTTLGKLRDSLLPRLISGELEIPDEMLVE